MKQRASRSSISSKKGSTVSAQDAAPGSSVQPAIPLLPQALEARSGAPLPEYLGQAEGDQQRAASRETAWKAVALLIHTLRTAGFSLMDTCEPDEIFVEGDAGNVVPTLGGDKSVRVSEADEVEEEASPVAWRIRLDAMATTWPCWVGSDAGED